MTSTTPGRGILVLAGLAPAAAPRRTRCDRCRVNIHPHNHDRLACDAMLAARHIKNQD